MNVSLLLEKYATINVGLANANFGKLLQLVSEGYYRSIVVIQIECYNAREGQWQPAIPGNSIAPFVQTELLVQMRRSYNVRVCVERVTGVLDAAGALVRVEDIVKLGEQIDDAGEYYRTMSLLHPGLGYVRGVKSK